MRHRPVCSCARQVRRPVDSLPLIEQAKRISMGFHAATLTRPSPFCEAGPRPARSTTATSPPYSSSTPPATSPTALWRRACTAMAPRSTPSAASLTAQGSAERVARPRPPRGLNLGGAPAEVGSQGDDVSAEPRLYYSARHVKHGRRLPDRVAVQVGQDHRFALLVRQLLHNTAQRSTNSTQRNVRLTPRVTVSQRQAKVSGPNAGHAKLIFGAVLQDDGPTRWVGVVRDGAVEVDAVSLHSD